MRTKTAMADYLRLGFALMLAAVLTVTVGCGGDDEAANTPAETPAASDTDDTTPRVTPTGTTDDERTGFAADAHR